MCLCFQKVSPPLPLHSILYTMMVMVVVHVVMFFFLFF